MASPDRHGGDDLASGDVDDRDRVGAAVGGVDPLAIGGECDTPRALADRDAVDHRVRRRIDEYHPRAAPLCHVDPFVVGRDRHADRFRVADRDGRDHTVPRHINHRHHATDLG
jgi:hypothetical protein